MSPGPASQSIVYDVLAAATRTVLNPW